MFTINMEECDEITRIYERQAETCVRAVSRFYDQIDGLARRTGYAPMVRFGNAISDFYQGELRRHLMNQFQIWYDGSYSFHALMQSIDAGSSAVSVARSKMDHMRRSLESMFRPSGGQIRTDTSTPNIQNRDFEEYRGYLQECIRSFDEASQEAQSSISRMQSGNDVVQLIGDIVKTTGESLKDSFMEMVRQVTEGEDFTGTGRDVTLGAMRGSAVTTDVHVPWGKGALYM